MYSQRYKNKLAKVDYLSSNLPIVICPHCQQLVDEDELVKKEGQWHCKDCK